MNNATGTVAKYFETILRALGCGSATCLFTVTVCQAADINAMPLKAPPLAPSYDWSGFYVGGHLGLATGSSDWTASPAQAGLPATSGSMNVFMAPDAFFESGSFLAGAQTGYNYMLHNRWVFGVEADASFPAYPDVNGFSITGRSSFNSGDAV